MAVTAKGVEAVFQRLGVGGPANGHGNAGTQKSSKLLQLSTIKPLATDWLWRNRIPRGAPTINTGLPGTGKSQQLLDVIAHVTTGADWPDGESCPCGEVILLTAEDVLESTVVPRLDAAGANRERVFTLPMIHVDAKTERSFLLTEDIAELERHLIERPKVLVVGIDPITAYLGSGRIDSHSATDVRGVLGPLGALAERRNVAIYTITHPAKATTTAINAFIGSQAFIAAARVGYLTIEEIDDEGRKTGRQLVTMVKTNLGPKMPTLAYRLAQIKVGEDHRDRRDILGSYVVWEKDFVDVTADQALAAASGKGKNAEPTQRDEVIEFLKIMFDTRSKIEVQELEREARAAGVLRAGLSISDSKPFRAAKDALGIESKHDGLNQGWYWEMGKAPSEGQGAPQIGGRLEGSRAPWVYQNTDKAQRVQPDGEPKIAPLTPTEDFLGPVGDDPNDFLDGYPDIPECLRR
jgi:putative DNA primase/helicase